jgi:hypothetical protein
VCLCNMSLGLWCVGVEFEDCGHVGLCRWNGGGKGQALSLDRGTPTKHGRVDRVTYYVAYWCARV